MAAVERFVTGALTELWRKQIDRTKSDWRLHAGNSRLARAHLPDEAVLDVSFRSPTLKKHLYLGRNHPFVEALCQYVMAHALSRQARTGEVHAARAAVMRSNEVTAKPRYCCSAVGTSSAKRTARHASSPRKCWSGVIAVRPMMGIFSPTTKLLRCSISRPAGDITAQSARKTFFENELKLIGQFRLQLIAVAEERTSTGRGSRTLQQIFPSGLLRSRSSRAADGHHGAIYSVAEAADEFSVHPH